MANFQKMAIDKNNLCLRGVRTILVNGLNGPNEKMRSCEVELNAGTAKHN